MPGSVAVTVAATLAATVTATVTAAATVTVAVTVAGVAGCGAPEEEIPTYFPAPSFRLTDQSARVFSSDALRGKVWIASFFFTSCRTVCPLTTSKMGNVRRRLAAHGDDVWFVSLSVDPEHDTPAALGVYARRMHADVPNWRFLTGSRADLTRAITGGFKQVMQDDPGDGSNTDLLHGTRLALVDRRGSVRGFYDTDAAGLAKLVSFAERLLAEAP